MKRARIDLYGNIGSSYDPNCSPENFLAALKKAEGDEIELHIHSPGGSIVDGLAMAHHCMSEARDVHCVVDGMAASMASVIACACDSLSMYRNAYMMIHNPWTVSVGDSDRLKHDAALLDSMKTQVLDFYGRRFPGKSKAELSKMMDDETWIPGAQAEEMGLKADILDNVLEAAAAIKTELHFAKVPESAKAFFSIAPASPAAPAWAIPAPDGKGNKTEPVAAVETKPKETDNAEKTE